MSGEGDESRVRRELLLAGVAGVHDFGRFVSNTADFQPSAFDEKGAMPTLLALLPTVTERKVAQAIAAHLRRSWARSTAFPTLLDSYRVWAEVDPTTAWTIGDALGTAARQQDAQVLLELCATTRYGMSRQMIVYALRRFKKAEGLPSLLSGLLVDPTVALHAAGTLRQVVGDATALPHLRAALAQSTDVGLSKTLASEIKKAEKRASA